MAPLLWKWNPKVQKSPHSYTYFVCNDFPSKVMPPQKKHWLKLACLQKIKTDKYPLLFTFLLLQSNHLYFSHSHQLSLVFWAPHGFYNCQIVRIKKSIKYKQQLCKLSQILFKIRKLGLVKMLSLSRVKSLKVAFQRDLGVSIETSFTGKCFLEPQVLQ